MPSVFSPFKPKGVSPNEEEGLAVPDPSASTDPQTGALIEKKTKEEKWFVARLDAFLLFYGCVSQVIKYLDQQNITAAYVSGMQEGTSTDCTIVASAGS
jgi:hypothetical protein